MTVDVARRAGLGELVRRSAARTPDAPAVVHFGERAWTYQALLEASEAAAGALTRLSVSPGDRVAVLGRNSDTYLITWLATQLAGAIHVPVNFMLNAREVAYIVEHSGARLALADEALFDRLPGITRTATLNDFEAAWDREAFSEPEIASTAVAQIVYTSGTESAPKGAMLTHEGLIAQYVSLHRRRRVCAATDVMLHALPLYHCAQLTASSARALPGRHQLILPAPTPARPAPRWRRTALTSFFAPPTVWIGLLRSPASSDATCRRCSRATTARRSCRSRCSATSRERLPGVRLWNLYGQTEIAPLATYLGPDEQLTKPGSAGRPALNVRRAWSTTTCATWGPARSARSCTARRRLIWATTTTRSKHRGRLRGRLVPQRRPGHVDADGYLTVVDRKKDMIKSGGENVASREVEEVLYRHPASPRSRCSGCPTTLDRGGDGGRRARRPGRRSTPDELVRFAARPGGFKAPKSVVFVDELPKNPSGKFLKRELRAQATS